MAAARRVYCFAGVATAGDRRTVQDDFSSATTRRTVLLNTPANTGNRLVVIDDEPMICEFVADVASAYGFEIRSCSGLGPFDELFMNFKPSMVLLDLNMPGQDGIEVLRYFERIGTQAGVVLMSGEGDRVLESALRLGRDLGLNMLGFMEKPLELGLLEQVLYSNWHGQWTVNERELSDALDRGEYINHYQPRVHRDPDGSWCIRDVEALVRWQHPRYGLLQPEHFIHQAEGLPLIGQLTDRIFQRAIRDARRWLEQDSLDVGVSINLPTTQLGDLGLPDRLSEMVQASGLAPSRITLEVTERGTMRDPAAASEILTRCRLKQFNLAMDDFGTGCSSLTNLAQLPFSELKIDKSFTSNIQHSSSDRAIVRSCIALAHSLGLKVCAEGVETADVFNLLDRLGCDAMQGYWISPAVDAADIPSMTRNFSYRRP